MQQGVLVNREDMKTAAVEMKAVFIRDILAQTGIDGLDECWPEDKFELSVDDRIKLRALLNKYDISIVDSGSINEASIYVEKELIGKWNKPRFELHVDHSQIDPSKKTFAKICLDYWSMFEETQEENM